jgi:hypothetical protein
VVSRNLPLPIGERVGERGRNYYLFVIEQRLCGETPSLTLPRKREREHKVPPQTKHPRAASVANAGGLGGGGDLECLVYFLTVFLLHGEKVGFCHRR